jgi:hypothetical protein
MMQKMKDVGLQHCRDDKWSDDVVKCMVEAKAETDAQACYGKLSAEQQDKMNKAAMALMKPAGGAGGGGPSGEGSAGGAGGAMGSAGGAMGSDTGSAGSAPAPK